MTENCIRNVGIFNGQYKVTIPKTIAQIMELKHKDKLEFSLDNDRIIIRRLK